MVKEQNPNPGEQHQEQNSNPEPNPNPTGDPSGFKANVLSRIIQNNVPLPFF